MKAQNLKMSELLKFNSEEGKIFLKNTRVLIMNSDAMGTLRKDLISTLGYERAKGFLIRFGWQCGYNDALSLKGQFDWDDELEWIKSGPVLHTLEGIANMIIEELNVRREEGKFLIKGKFLNSFESEEHIRYFGIHDSPICWMFIGYAGGYGSCYMGKKVIYKEIKCVGKGDPYCELIGRTVEEWGDEINAELPYYEEEKISEELDNANETIRQQNIQLQKAFDVQKQLTNLVFNGAGLNGITKTLAEMIDGLIMVVDHQIQSLVMYACRNMPYSILQHQIKDTLLSESFNLTPPQKTFIKKSPYWLNFKVDNEEYFSIIVPIVAKEEVLGFVAAVPRDRTKNDLIMAIQHSSSVYAFELVKQKTIVDLEQQFRIDFFNSLFAHVPSDEETLKAWALRFGHDITSPNSIIVMHVNHLKTSKISTLEHISPPEDELIKLLHSTIKTYPHPILFGKFNDYFVFLFDSKMKNSRKSIIQFTSELTQNINLQFSKTSFSIGVSQMVNKVSDYLRSYRQAIKAIRIGKLFDIKDQAIFYQDFGSMTLLLEANNKEDLLDFMYKTLGPLVEYDLHYHTELLLTLEQYLCSRNLQETSRETALSMSGLKYRLNKIKELGYDLHSQEERFDLRIALGIWKINQKS